MTIKQKIIGKSIASAVLVAVIGAISAVNMRHFHGSLTTIDRNELPQLHGANRLAGAAAQARWAMADYLAAAREGRQSDALRLKAEVDAIFADISSISRDLNEEMEKEAAEALA